LSQYESLAARRYRQYRWQERKSAIKKAIMDLLMRLLKIIGKMLSKRRTVEKVVVE
jgi:hypothetical protein